MEQYFLTHPRYQKQQPSTEYTGSVRGIEKYGETLDEMLQYSAGNIPIAGKKNYTGRNFSIVTDSIVGLAALASCNVTSTLTDRCLGVLVRLGFRKKQGEDDLKCWTPPLHPECTFR